MSYDNFDLKGQGAVYFGFETNATLAKTDEGKSARIVAGKVDVGAADTPLAGKIKNINGNEASVQTRGYAQFDYSGTAPTAGAYNNLECAASGKVQVDGVNGHPFLVTSVDTTALTCIVWLG